MSPSTTDAEAWTAALAGDGAAFAEILGPVRERVVAALAAGDRDAHRPKHLPVGPALSARPGPDPALPGRPQPGRRHRQWAGRPGAAHTVAPASGRGRALCPAGLQHGRRRRRARDRRGHREVTPENQHLFDQLADILQRGDVPTDLRAAAYRALALVPGIIVAADTVVLDGATGTAFAVFDHDRAAKSQELVIDPATGRYLGERLMLSEADGHVPAGVPLELTAVSTSVADTAPR